MARTEATKLSNGIIHNEKVPNGSVTVSEIHDEKTDYTRWRLLDERGRQTWHYLQTDEEVEQWPQSTADKYHLGLPTVNTPLSTTPAHNS